MGEGERKQERQESIRAIVFAFAADGSQWCLQPPHRFRRPVAIVDGFLDGRSIILGILDDVPPVFPVADPPVVEPELLDPLPNSC